MILLHSKLSLSLSLTLIKFSRKIETKMSVSIKESGNISINNNNNNFDDPHECYQLYRLSSSSTSTTTSISEIEEEESSSQNDDVPREIKELFEIKKFAPMPSIREEQFDKGSVISTGEDCVYVAVGKSTSSMDALDWTLKHVVSLSPPSIIVYLIHIFPEIRQIPTPCKYFRIISIFFF